MHDLVIRGGTVVDGTGAPARTADVAVTDGTITEVGRVDGRARREVGADGLLVTPGFVDIHTHYDGQVTWDDDLGPSCWHGVTTAILGNCGVGFAPVRAGAHTDLIELMEGVEDIPGSALSEGIRWSWEGFPEYLDALDRRRLALDVGTHVPHAAVRAYVMGERAQDDATEAELAEICDVVRSGLEAGALGFSTGRTAGHRDVRGKPVPGTFAAERELAAILGVMDDVGAGVFEVVPAGVGGEITGDVEGAMETELDWLVRQGERTRRPITFLVMERPEVDHWRPWFDAARRANDRGAELRPQVGNRCFGVLMGHQSKLNPFQYRATYRELVDLPLPERVALLRDPEIRARILGEEPDFSGPYLMDQIGRRALDHVYPLGDALDYEPRPDTSIRAVATRRGVDPWEVAYDSMLDHDGTELLLWPLLNYGNDNYDGLLAMMEDPISVQGLGDAGAHVSLVCDATMTTYMLSHWTRDRSRGPQLPLERAVRRLTADPARLYGLRDRGVLAPGMKADVNVIDHAGLRLLRPQQIHDLPGGVGPAGPTRPGLRRDGGERRGDHRPRRTDRRPAGPARAWRSMKLVAERSPTAIKILDATFEVLARCGPRKLSLSDVATVAGVSRPTLYRWFPSKEVLLSEFGLYEQERYEAGLAAAIQGLDGDARLDAVLRHIVDFQYSYSLGRILEVEPEHVLDQFRRMLPITSRQLRPHFDGPDGPTVAAIVARISVSHALLPDGDPDGFLRELRIAAGLGRGS